MKTEDVPRSLGAWYTQPRGDRMGVAYPTAHTGSHASLHILDRLLSPVKYRVLPQRVA